MNEKWIQSKSHANMEPSNLNYSCCCGFGYQQYLAILTSLIHTDCLIMNVHSLSSIHDSYTYILTLFSLTHLPFELNHYMFLCFDTFWHAQMASNVVIHLVLQVNSSINIVDAANKHDRIYLLQKKWNLLFIIVLNTNYTNQAWDITWLLWQDIIILHKWWPEKHDQNSPPGLNFGTIDETKSVNTVLKTGHGVCTVTFQ